jgi:predicted ATPase
MDSLRIQGLRSLKDTGKIKIAPLTILVGENSAGKSTFLRTFPLIKQSLTSSTRGAILWYGSYVDFGDFEQALSKYSQNDSMKFSFGIDTTKLQNVSRHYFLNFLEKSFYGKYEIIIELRKDKKKNAKIFEIAISYNGINTVVKFDIQKTKIASVIIDKNDVSSYFKNSDIGKMSAGSLFPVVMFDNAIERSYKYKTRMPHVFVNEEILNEMSDKLTPYVRKGTNLSDIVQQVIRCDIGSKKAFFAGLLKASNAKTWKTKIDAIKQTPEKLDSLISLVMAYQLPPLLYLFNEYFSDVFRGISYIAPLRATAERYYRTQNLSVEQVDHQGSNLPMFIDNLSDSQKSIFKDWMKENFGFYLDARSSTGHLSLYLQYEKSDTSYNVTDMGFGFSQILPIITQLWFTASRQPDRDNHFGISSKIKMLVIEQPELHLHPRMQANLIDVFIKAIKLCKTNDIELKIIVETHSETIVNYLGRAIIKDKISNQDTSIVIFNKNGPDEPTEVTVSSYDDEGCLIDWPWGFFDTE